MRLRISKELHAKAVVCAERAGLSLTRWVVIQIEKHGSSPVERTGCGSCLNSTVIELSGVSAEPYIVRGAIAAGIAGYDAANDAELHNALVVQASFEGKTVEQVKLEFDEKVERRKRELEGGKKA